MSFGTLARGEQRQHRRCGMVAVTERARERLLEMKFSASINQPEVGFRLKPAADDRWRLVPDEATESDQVVEHAGSTVLLIDADLSHVLDDGEVDCIETAAGQLELVLTRGEEA
jgi:Fe-S cluster assembly iron-binding protein IscA